MWVTIPNPAGIITTNDMCFSVPLYTKSLHWGNVPQALKLAMRLRQGKGGRLSDKAYEIPLEECDKIIGEYLLDDNEERTDEECIGEDLLKML